MSPAELRALLLGDPPALLVDVREAAERESGAIPGSLAVPLARLRSGAGLADVPDGPPLVLYCSVGLRSAEAARLLRAAGRGHVLHLAGGYAAWRLYLAESAAGAPGEPRGVVGSASPVDEGRERERVLP